MLKFILYTIMSLCFTQGFTQKSKKQLKGIPKENSLIENILLKEIGNFKNILQKRKELGVQIVYTQIDRDKKGIPKFTDFTFNVDTNNYFYPASTVKMPIAFLALEKLNELNIKGLDLNTIMITDSNYHSQTVVYNQPTAIDGKPTIANYIKQIFLVSDNDAFNRLYEFLGQEYISKKMKEKGYSALIKHRLQIPLTPEENRHTNAIYFYDLNGNLIYKQEPQYNNTKTKSLNVKLGKGYMTNGKLIEDPFDFSHKNQVFLQELHKMLQSVIFHQYYPNNKKFLLTEKDINFVTDLLKSYPSESKYPPYDTAQYWDTYCKFLYYGSEKCNIDTNIRIYNKVGDAYGFLIDVAYIQNKSKNIEFLLSAVINCNVDGIYNDDKYEYETIGFPFMKNLGKTIYNYEINRKKNK